ncbi:MAG: redoxin family protein [Planctomycetota bacterium]|nr:redoxin family protein [Planctomycetota bacterium]MDA1262844.1 redoxin family protein [Planctomycetota bacterium]
MLMRAIGAMFMTLTLIAASHCAPSPKPDLRLTRLSIPLGDLPTTDFEGRPLPFGKLATVYLFAGPECPICRAYSPEISRLAIRDQERGIAWVLIFSEFDIEAEVIQTFRREYSMPLPAVIDPSQKFACELGAQIIPSVVVLDANRNVLYRGRIDDRYKGLGVSYGPPTKRDLADVTDAIAAGNPLPFACTTAVGCVLPRCKP